MEGILQTVVKFIALRLIVKRQEARGPTTSRKRKEKEGEEIRRATPRAINAQKRHDCMAENTVNLNNTLASPSRKVYAMIQRLNTLKINYEWNEVRGPIPSRWRRCLEKRGLEYWNSIPSEY
jgi:hypothetical protein